MASKVSGKAVPDYNLCDVVVYRQIPAIVRNDNFVLNNFSGIGHYIEFIPAATLNETSGLWVQATTLPPPITTLLSKAITATPT